MRSENYRGLSFAFVSLGSALVFAGAAHSNPGGTGGCAAGFEFVSVDELDDVYRSARIADNLGNNDGYVCRRALGDGFHHDAPGRPDTVYLWLDNEEPHDYR